MSNTNWIYIKSAPDTYTVGVYSSDGVWHADTDHANSDAAAQRVHWLNGGIDAGDALALVQFKQLKAEIKSHDAGPDMHNLDEMLEVLSGVAAVIKAIARLP